MTFKKTDMLEIKTGKGRVSPVTAFVKKELDSIPDGQGLSLAQLVSSVLGQFPELANNKRSVYVKINHILRASASKYKRYTTPNSSGKGNVYIGRVEG